MLQIENDVLIRCFVRHDATWDHLQFLVSRKMHRDFAICSQFLTWGTPGSEKD